MQNNYQIKKRDLRNFGVITGVIVVMLFGLLMPWLLNNSFPKWPWYVAGILISWGLLFPNSLRPVYKGWMAFGAILGWINTRIILIFVFYLVVMPVGFLVRLFGVDPMARKLDPRLDSYRVKSEVTENSRLERPF